MRQPDAQDAVRGPIRMSPRFWLIAALTGAGAAESTLMVSLYTVTLNSSGPTGSSGSCAAAGFLQQLQLRRYAVNPLGMATAERADLADFLATLTREQWESPSLCEGWRVRDVVAHVMSFDGVNLLGMLRRAIRGRIVHINQAGVDELALISTEQLLDRLRARLRPQGLATTWEDGSPCSMSPSIIKTSVDRLVRHARSRLNGCAWSWA